jgi:hypothetical protein
VSLDNGGTGVEELQLIVAIRFANVRLSNIFVIGEGNKPLVSLPKGKGVKLSIAGAFGVLLSFVS